MKKCLLGVALALLIVVPVMSHALTIAELRAQIAALTAQLQTMMGVSVTSTSSVVASVCTIPAINKDLTVGSKGTEVSALQQYLIDEGFLDSDGPTGYFGVLTRNAVLSWEKKYNISPSLGAIGPIDRAVLAELATNCADSPVFPTVSINSVSGPTSLNVGQTGTWSLKVIAPSGTNLIYNVNWGDLEKGGVAPTSKGDSAVNQGSTFTHSYSQAGTYTVHFDVYRGGSCNGGKCYDPEFPSAQTSLTVVVGGSNGLGKPIVKFTGGPISIVNERIRVIFVGTVSAIDGDIYLPKDTAFSGGFYDSKGIGYWTKGCVRTAFNYPSDLPIFYDSTDQRPLILIKNGTSANYKVEITCPVNELFAGVYRGELSGMSYMTSPSAGVSYSPSLSVLSTNSQYIVGEQGPYISSATYEQGKTFGDVKLKGERLVKVNKVYFNGKQVSLVNWPSASDNKLSFSVSQRAGTYPVFVTSAVGESNTVFVTISEGTVQSNKQCYYFDVSHGGPVWWVQTRASSGAWTNTTACPNGCSNGVCSGVSVASTSPVINSVSIDLSKSSAGVTQWPAGTTKKITWSYSGFSANSNNTVSLYFCHPTTENCVLGRNSDGTTSNNLASGTSQTGLATFSTPIGVKILSNTEMAPYISNGQARLKICPNATNGVCAFSPVFQIINSSSTTAKATSVEINQLGNILKALQGLLDQLKSN